MSNSNTCFNIRGTTLEVLTNARLPGHPSALNDRISAHYT